jgi:hypothetical protein
MHDSVRVEFESTESVSEWQRSTQYEQCLVPLASAASLPCRLTVCNSHHPVRVAR